MSKRQFKKLKGDAAADHGFTSVVQHMGERSFSGNQFCHTIEDPVVPGGPENLFGGKLGIFHSKPQFLVGTGVQGELGIGNCPIGRGTHTSIRSSIRIAIRKNG